MRSHYVSAINGKVQHLAEYTVGRVCQSSSTTPGNIAIIPPEAVQATLNTRISDIESVSQDRYDYLFDRVRAESEARVSG